MILVFAWVLFLVIYKACQAQAIIEGLIKGEPVETLLAVIEFLITSHCCR